MGMQTLWFTTCQEGGVIYSINLDLEKKYGANPIVIQVYAHNAISDPCHISVLISGWVIHTTCFYKLKPGFINNKNSKIILLINH